MRNSSFFLQLMLAFGLGVAGCSKKAPTTSNEVGRQTVAPAAPVPASPGDSARAQAEQEAPFQMHDLQLSVEGYQKITRRKLTSLDQLVQEGFLTRLPQAPPGKRYSLDSATSRVSLVPQ